MEDSEGIEFTNRPKASAIANIDNVQFSSHQARGFTGLQALDVSGLSEPHRLSTSLSRLYNPSSGNFPLLAGLSSFS